MSSPLDLDDLTPVEEALGLILDATEVAAPEQVALSMALRHVLAEDLCSDVDVPPFPRCAMDGYALRAGDSTDAPVRLRVIGTVHAGEIFKGQAGPGEAVKVMTGAPLPTGCDAVQKVELTHPSGDDAEGSSSEVTIQEAVLVGRHVSPQGEDLRIGDVALSAGELIAVAQVGLLAVIGRSEVPVIGRPLGAVVSTGDELVEVGEKPGPGQIRNSNGPMLAVLLRTLGCNPVQLLPASGDDIDSLTESLRRGLDSNILLVSGGVSKGDRDHVGEVLESLGVRPLLHGVDIQPGKPLWVGVGPRGLVFGLPGNPVSALTTARFMAGPAIRKMRGLGDVRSRFLKAKLAEPFQRHARRPGYLSAIVRTVDGGLSCTPLSSRGSADLTAAIRANATWIAPAGKGSFEVGEQVDVLLHEDHAERSA